MMKSNGVKGDNKALIIIFYIIIIVCTVVSVLPSFRPYVLLGEDRGFHLNRLLGLSEVLKRGRFLFDINSYAQMGYGMADPIDYPFLFHYPSAILLALGGGG